MINFRDRVVAAAFVGMILGGGALQLGALASSAAPASAAAAAQAEPTPPPPERIIGAVVRFTSSGPVVHFNSIHANTAVESMTIRSDGALILDLVASPWPSGAAVVDSYVDEDESLSGRYFCGGSGGVTNLLIKCRDRGGAFVRADSPALVCSTCNLWVQIHQRDASLPAPAGVPRTVNALAAGQPASARPGIAPMPPRPHPTYRCEPGIDRAGADAVLIRGRGGAYLLYEGAKQFRRLSPAQLRRATWCDRIGSPGRVVS